MKKYFKTLDKKHVIVYSILILSIIISVFNVTYAKFLDEKDSGSMNFTSTSNFGIGTVTNTNKSLEGNLTTSKNISQQVTVQMKDVSNYDYLVTLIGQVDEKVTEYITDGNLIKYEVYHKTNNSLTTSSATCTNNQYTINSETNYCTTGTLENRLDGIAFGMLTDYKIKDTNNHYFDVYIYITNNQLESKVFKIDFYLLVKETTKEFEFKLTTTPSSAIVKYNVKVGTTTTSHEATGGISGTFIKNTIIEIVSISNSGYVTKTDIPYTINKNYPNEVIELTPVYSYTVNTSSAYNINICYGANSSNCNNSTSCSSATTCTLSNIPKGSYVRHDVTLDYHDPQDGFTSSITNNVSTQKITLAEKDSEPLFVITPSSVTSASGMNLWGSGLSNANSDIGDNQCATHGLSSGSTRWVAWHFNNITIPTDARIDNIIAEFRLGYSGSPTANTTFSSGGTTLGTHNQSSWSSGYHTFNIEVNSLPSGVNANTIVTNGFQIQTTFTGNVFAGGQWCGARVTIEYTSR